MLLYLDKRYEVNLSLVQLNILLAFHNNDVLSQPEMIELSGTDKAQFSSTVQPFLELGLILSDAQSFRLNLEFRSNRIKIKMPISFGTYQKEDASLVKEVESDRRYYLQALIVRIMKSKMQRTHVELVGDILKESKSRFVPSTTIIKSCIESLIEKQYIERTGVDNDSYLYIS